MTWMDVHNTGMHHNFASSKHSDSGSNRIPISPKSKCAKNAFGLNNADG